MKNCKFDTHGHMISYESDNGSTITDYKQLAKSMGLTNDNSNDHQTYSGGYASSVPSGVLFFAVGAIVAVCAGIFLLLAWLFFDKAWAITFTVIFGVAIVGGLLFLLRSMIGELLIPIIAGLGLITLIVLTVVSWNYWVLPVSIILTIILGGVALLGFIWGFKKIWI